MLDIVISGLSGRFPNSDNVEDFWEHLIAGDDMITAEPRRWPAGIFGLPERAGLLNDITSFDATFFGVSAKQAHQMDPQLRILLEVCYEAILDSGYHPNELQGKKIGVYVGGSSSEAYDAWTSNSDTQTGYGLLGCCRCMLANRVAFTFDLRGPSYTLDTACSSAMVAIDAAVKAIQCGECDMALAAGVNLLLKPNTSLDFHKLSMLSKDGSCKVFDEKADGYVRSETVAAVILSKQTIARRAYAKVLGTMTNTDGYKGEGITYPNHAVQAALLKDLYGAAGVSPDDVYYLEMHGTGTQVGDLQEMLGVEEFFLPRSEPLYVGSVKSNMGHSEPSSGVAALAKVLMSYHYKKIPANINFSTPNPKLTPLVEGTVKPVVSHLELNHNNIIGVNSFGFGGANAHIILQGVSRDEPMGVKSDIPMLVPYYGRLPEHTRAALCRLRDEHITHDKLSYMHMVCENSATLNTSRGYVVLNGTKREPVVSETSSPAKRPLWFIMTGMGAQWPEMGRDMLRYPTFRSSIDACSRALASIESCNIDLYHLITDGNAHLHTPDNAFVGLCAVQIGLVDLLAKFGILPDGLVGHSVGELVCGYADTCLDIKQTIVAAYFRGKCIKDAELGEGGMAAVGLTWEEAADVCPEGVVPACHNAEDSVTISGDKKLVTQVVAKLTEEGVFAKPVNSCGVAFHSPVVAKIGPQLLACLQSVVPNPKRRSKNWICTSRPESDWDKASHCGAGYLSNNLVSPVLFHSSLQHIPENSIVVEIAACGLLQSILKRTLPTCSVIPLMKRNDPKCVEFFLNSIGTLWNWGVNPRFGEFYEAPSLPLVDLPPMASLINWDHSVQYNTPSIDDFGSGGSGAQASYTYKVDTTDTSNAYHTMRDHVIDGRNLLPATGYIYFVWRAIATRNHSTIEHQAVELRDIKLHQATILNTSRPSTMVVTLLPGAKQFEVTEGDTLVVSGRYLTEGEETKPQPCQVPSNTVQLQPEAIYKEFRLRGYDYGPLYQGILHADSAGVSGELEWTGDWVSFLDTLLQVQLIGGKSRSLRLPTRIRKIQLEPHSQPSEETVTFHVNHDTNQCWAGGVVIEGLHTTLTQRRTDLRPVMLETYEFVPYHSTTDIPLPFDSIPSTSHIDSVNSPACIMFLETASLRHLLDIAQENITNESALSVCEIGGCSDFRKLCYSALNCNPGRPECTYSIAVGDERTKLISDDETDIVSFVWDVTSEQIQSKYDVIITSSVTCSTEYSLVNILNSLNNEGFMILLAFKHHTPSYVLEEVAECVSVKSCEFADLMLLRAKRKEEFLQHKIIPVSTTELDWVETLQTAVSDSAVDRIWLQGDHTTGVQGLCNALRREEGAEKIRSILSPAELSRDKINQEMSRDLVSNVYRAGTWGTYRHDNVTSSAVTSSSFAYVDTVTRGDLSSLSWVQGPSQIKSDNKIVCDVEYASLNFRDIMIATGKLPPDALPLEMQGSSDCVLGMEFSGTRGNKRLMGILPVKALATKVVTEEAFTWEVPDSWSLEAAASVPVVYCTAYYSLITRGRLMAGERVLIHSGSGGVGQAAISIALSMGCDVYTTCGSQQKIDFLLDRFPSLPRDHILYSRSTKFEQDIMSLTNSKGVHVVLNSLSDDKLKASLRCVGRHGRFLEIGKYDLSEDNPIGLSVFLRNISFHGILLDALFESDNPAWREVRDMLSAGIQSGVVRPLPTTCFKNNQLEQAFRYMAQGKHIGKVVICTRDETGAPPKTVLPRFTCHPNKMYIVTGGLGGFGLELVQWLVEQGARHVTVTSRTGLKSDYQRWVVSRLTNRGVEVTIATQDTTTEEGVRQLLTDTTLPVTAIFHLAGILRDGLLENLTIQQFREVYQAKVSTALHLDVLSRDLCTELEHFVCFSSVVSGRGNSGQSNYAAANSTLERICENRKVAGYPGLAIQWGAIGDVGMAHSMVGNDANIGGTYPQRIWNCLSTMARCMMMDTAITSSIVLADKQNKAAASSDADLVSVISNILGASDPSKLDHNATLGDMGLDSLMGVEVKQALDRANIQMSSKKIRVLTLSAIKDLQNKDSATAPKLTAQIGSISSLLELKTVENSIPLYLIHPITLEIEPLRNIAQHLPCTVVALQFTDNAPLDSIEVLSSYYLSQITAHRGSGRYRLGGYSLGSLIAFQMALELQERNQSDLDYLVLIDGSPNSVHDQIETGKEAAQQRSGKVVDKPTETIMNFIRRKFGGTTPDMLYEKVAALSPDVDAQTKLAISILQETMPNIATEELSWRMSNFTKLLLLAEQYKPAALLQTPVHLLKAEHSHQDATGDYGLSELSKGPITVNTVPGTHETCVSDHAHEIAQHISDTMANLAS